MANSFSESNTGAIAAVGAIAEAIRAVDVPALSAENVINLAVLDEINDTKLSYENLAFMGAPGQKTLKDHFHEGAPGGAPDAALWDLVTDGAGTIVIDYIGTNHTVARLTAGDVNNENSSMDTEDLIVFDTREVGGKILCCRFQNWSSNNTGQFGIGFTLAVGNKTAVEYGNTQQHIALYCNNGVVLYSMADGTNEESVDVSAFCTAGTLREYFITYEFNVESKLYIDGTLRGTLTTRNPTSAMKFGHAVRNQNGIATLNYFSSAEAGVYLLT